VDANVTGSGHPERVELLAVSPNYFSLLGVHAQLGRVFGPQDKAEGFAEAALLSYDFWQRNFGGDPHVLGRRVRLDGDAYTVVGVMPREFHHPGRTVATDVDMWATAGFSADPFPSPPPRSSNFIPGAIARLKLGMTLQQAQARLDSFTAQLRAQYPNDYRPEARYSIQIEPLKDALTGNVRPMLFTLLGAVAMMLLIGCVNIANLLLVRAAGRQPEIAVRQSLGATKCRPANWRSRPGMARTIYPVNTMFDGDIVFALSLGSLRADINTLGVAAAEAVAVAIVRAVTLAKSLGGVPGLG
jgi:putative ABC transport system permease protein